MGAEETETMNANAPLRTEALDRGLNWAAVRAAYREEKAEAVETRQRPNDVRATAWQIYTASRPKCWPFWRHGFLARFGGRLARGADHTTVPGYDEIGQQIAGAFPEYATTTDTDGTARLFDFLFTPYDKLPDRDELYRRAMDRVECEEVGSGEWIVGSDEEF